MSPFVRRAAYRTTMFVLAVALVGVLWELYKALGPEDGGKVFGISIFPRSNDTAMPHIWDMLARYGRPEVRGSDRKIWVVVLSGAWFSFRLSLVGFALGASIGVGLAVLMTRYKVVERGLLPYLVVSQTVPLIALAPLVVSWGGKLEIGSFVWPRWLSASVLGAFLAFFPIAVGTLRGLSSAPAAALELMESYASTWRQTLTKLRFPAAVPYMVPAFKLGASGSVVGVVGPGWDVVEGHRDRELPSPSGLVRRLGRAGPQREADQPRHDDREVEHAGDLLEHDE